MLDYKVLFNMHCKYVEQPVPDCTSIRDRVVSDLTHVDKPMYVAVVSDSMKDFLLIMKDFLLITPSAWAREEKIERTGPDALGALAPDAIDARNDMSDDHV